MAGVLGASLAHYSFGDGHPFEPERDAAFLRKFAARGLHERLQRSERAPPPMRSS